LTETPVAPPSNSPGMSPVTASVTPPMLSFVGCIVATTASRRVCPPASACERTRWPSAQNARPPPTARSVTPSTSRAIVVERYVAALAS
jgi:hypothetical protein